MELDILPDARDYERYFHLSALGPKKSKSKTDMSELAGVFDRPAVPVETLRQFNPAIYESEFPKWYTALKHFSLLFYGLGSKIELLKYFSKNYLGQYGYVIEADMFSGQPRLFNTIVKTLCEVTLAETHSLSSLISNLQMRGVHVFVVLNSIDTDSISDVEFQNNLIECANSGHIHIIASIDRTPLLPLRLMSGMKFYPVKIETGCFYTQEIGFSNSSKTSTNLDSIDRFVGVLKTLTEIANGIYSVLIEHQISTGDGLTKNEWSDLATTKLCVKVKGTFSTNITEFLDHKLITEKKGGDFFTIPLQPIQLKSLKAKLDSNE